MHRTTRSTLISGAAITLAVVALAGCVPASDGATGGAGSSKHPGELVWTRAAASNGWEGDKCINSSIPLNPAVYDTLLRDEVPDGDGLAPGLAEEWSYDDTTFTYSFTLRDAKFSNGDPLTADDVVFSVDRWTSGEVSGSYYTSVDQATAVDEKTVQIHMKQNDTFLPALLTWCTSPIYPADFAGLTEEEYFQAPIGAGPYTVASWDDPEGTSEKIVFEPNEHYYGWEGGEPPLKRITVETISDTSQRVLRFQTGESDLLDDTDSAMSAQLPTDTVVRTVPNQVDGIMSNMNNEILADANVRAAISYGVDRDAIAQALDDESIAAEGYLPVNVPGTIDPTVPYSYDPEKATELIASSAYPDGVTLTFLYDPADKRADTTAQSMQSQLKEVGIEIKLETTDNNTLLSRQIEGNTELSWSGVSAISPTIFDPISYIVVLYDWAGNDPTPINDQFLAGTGTTDQAGQDAAALALQDLIMERNSLIGFVHVTVSYAAQTWIEGFQPLQYGTFYLDTLSG